MKIIVSKEKKDKPDYNSINEALNNANDFDTIYIKPGDYNEFLCISKNIKLIGDSKNNDINLFFNSDKKIDDLIFITETCKLENINIVSNYSTAIHIFSCFDVIIKNCNIQSQNYAFSIMGAGDYLISNCKINSKDYCVQYNNLFDNIGNIMNCNLKSDGNNILLTKNAVLKIENSNIITQNSHNIILRDEAQVFLKNTALKSKQSNVKLREYALKKNVILQNTEAEVS